MAIAFDGVSTGTKNGSSTLTFDSHTIGSGGNMVGFAIVHVDNTSLPSGFAITIGGLSPEKLYTQTGTPSTGLYFMHIPDAWAGTAQSIVNSWSSGTCLIRVSFVTYSGVQTLRRSSINAAGSAGSTAPSVVCTSATGDTVVDFVCANSTTTNTLTVGAGQTSRSEEETRPVIGISDEAGGASVTMSWTLGGSEEWATHCASLVPMDTYDRPTIMWDSWGVYGDTTSPLALTCPSIPATKVGKSLVMAAYLHGGTYQAYTWGTPVVTIDGSNYNMTQVVNKASGSWAYPAIDCAFWILEQVVPGTAVSISAGWTGSTPSDSFICAWLVDGAFAGTAGSSITDSDGAVGRANKLYTWSCPQITTTAKDIVFSMYGTADIARNLDASTADNQCGLPNHLVSDRYSNNRRVHYFYPSGTTHDTIWTTASDWTNAATVSMSIKRYVGGGQFIRFR